MRCRTKIYFFKTLPVDSFGFISIYTISKKSDESVFMVKNDDSFVVTEGYHPVLATPECQLYYLWAMTGSHGEIVTVCDPAYAVKKNS